MKALAVVSGVLILVSAVLFLVSIGRTSAPADVSEAVPLPPERVKNVVSTGSACDILGKKERHPSETLAFTDGDTATGTPLPTNKERPSVLVVDLGETRKISQVDVYCTGSDALRLSVSGNGKVFYLVGTEQPDADKCTFGADGTEYRYVRIEFSPYAEQIVCNEIVVTEFVETEPEESAA